MTYFHNADEEMLYALPPEPEFESKINRYGESKGWIVSVTVQISTPNNVYKRGRWLIPFEVTHRHEYQSHVKRKDMISNFRKKYYPTGRNLTEADYLAMKAEYDARSGII